jgi:hypothetical protein
MHFLEILGPGRFDGDARPVTRHDRGSGLPTTSIDDEDSGSGAEAEPSTRSVGTPGAFFFPDLPNPRTHTDGPRHDSRLSRGSHFDTFPSFHP